MVDGKVVGGHFVGATITLDRKGQLATADTALRSSPSSQRGKNSTRAGVVPDVSSHR